MGAKLDLEELSKQIRTMSVRSELYKVLKRELSAKGWWKNRPRGKVTDNRKKNTAE